MTMYQVDMDILQNTRDFLYTRTLQCMKTQKGEGHVHRKFHPTKGNSKVKARDLFRPTPEPLPVTTQASKIYFRLIFKIWFPITCCDAQLKQGFMDWNVKGGITVCLLSKDCDSNIKCIFRSSENMLPLEFLRTMILCFQCHITRYIMNCGDKEHCTCYILLS